MGEGKFCVGFGSAKAKAKGIFVSAFIGGVFLVNQFFNTQRLICFTIIYTISEEGAKAGDRRLMEKSLG